MNRTKQLWADALAKTWYGAKHRLMARTVDRLPVVVIRRKTQREREHNAFLLGVEAARVGSKVADA